MSVLAVRPDRASVREIAAAAWVVAVRDVARQVGRPSSLAAQALQMAFFLLVYAIGFSSMVGSVDGVGFAAYVYPGLIAIHVISTSINAGLTFAWDRTYGFMRELMVAPVPRWTVLAGKITGTAVIAAGHATVLTALAPLVGVQPSLGRFAGAVAVCTLGGAAFCAFGLLLAVAVRRVETLQNVVQLALYPILFLSGSVFRPDQLPAWFTWTMLANPASYVVDLLRHTTLAAPFPSLAPPGVDLLVVVGFATAATVVARWKVGR